MSNIEELKVFIGTPLVVIVGLLKENEEMIGNYLHTIHLYGMNKRKRLPVTAISLNGQANSVSKACS